jgi:hypothetical protein
MLAAGFGIGFRAGSPKPTPGKPTLVAVNRPDPTPVQAPPEPKTRAPEPKPDEPKKDEPKAPEPPPMPRAEPPPTKKPEPKPEPMPKKVEPPPKSAGPVVEFARVAPVFKDKCTICHGGVEPKGGLDLRNAKAAITGGDSGAGVKPGDPDNSPIWQSIMTGTMPPKNKPQLTEAEKKLIKDWIAGGAK